MGKSPFKVKIFDNIYNQELKNAWIELQHSSEVYPQMFYEWIEPWIKLNFGDRKLYVISVLENEEIITLLPVCIERWYGLKILRNIPIHFGDFYYLVGKSNDNILNFLITYLMSDQNYQVINFQNINTDSTLFKKLSESPKFHKKISSDIVNTNSRHKSMEDLIASLSKNQRKSLKRRIRKGGELGDLRFEIISSSQQYDFYEKEMKEIYFRRWKENRTVEKELVFEYRKLAFIQCLEMKKSLGFILLLDDKPIAYCLGFYFKEEFRSWKLVYDYEYSIISPGILITAEILVFLAKNNVNFYNHGNGFYPYKLEWFESQIMSTNFQFLYSHSLIGRGFLYYELNWKSKLKRIFQSKILMGK